MHKRFFLKIEYDGTDYVGWQAQKEAPSIQEKIEEAIYAFAQEKVKLHVSGRTDAGVHALGQVAHFDLAKSVQKEDVPKALNYYLKDSGIAILDVAEVTHDDHARFSALKRSYIYKIKNRKAPLTIDRNRFWHVKYPLNLDKMIEASKFLIGEHDFSSFRDSQCQADKPIRTIDHIQFTQKDDEVEMFIEARSFLHHMVRNIIGTLYYVGNGKISVQKMKEILEAKDRRAAGLTAPPHGLYFKEVYYKKNPFKTSK